MWFEAALTRLRAALPDMKLVDGASSLAQAMQGARVVPALYLVPLADQAQEQPHTGAVDQLVRLTFGVIFALDAGRSARGTDVVLELEARRQQVRQALVGWVPDDALGEPVVYLGGELLDMPADARLWWADDFALTTYFRSTV